jgi:hypothetical protein
MLDARLDARLGERFRDRADTAERLTAAERRCRIRSRAPVKHLHGRSACLRAWRRWRRLRRDAYTAIRLGPLKPSGIPGNASHPFPPECVKRRLLSAFVRKCRHFCRHFLRVMSACVVMNVSIPWLRSRAGLCARLLRGGDTANRPPGKPRHDTADPEDHVAAAAPAADPFSDHA